MFQVSNPPTILAREGDHSAAEIGGKLTSRLSLLDYIKQ